MIINEREIEHALRAAPKPKAPAGLKERLITQVRLPEEVGAAASGQARGGVGGWFRRWWPMLVPGAASLACAAVFGVQQAEIRDLKQNIESRQPNDTNPGNVGIKPAITGGEPVATLDTTAPPEQELARLKELVARLSAEVSGLETLRAENDKLRKQISQRASESLTPAEAEAIAKAKERAEYVACINNMKQLGLAARVWALDNGDVYPANIIDMTNELNTPKILRCPGDHGRQTASRFASYTPANCSYEYLAPGGSDTEPERVMFRCPIHGSITLCDGSVQGGVAKSHPQSFVERDGKLYFQNSTETPPANAATPAGEGPKQ